MPTVHLQNLVLEKFLLWHNSLIQKAEFNMSNSGTGGLVDLEVNV